MVKVIRYAARLFLAVTMGLALLGFLPGTVQADANPVDLELGGEGAMPWTMSNIEPGDSGTKTVELRNVGSENGFATIWVSDIISSEGMNPESETGDTAEPGEINDHLLLGLSADGLSTNLNLPTTINDLPHSASGSHYVDIIPLKTGDTVNLQWEWELPTQTGNDVQGDGISFTINYLLEGFEVTDVDDGVFTEEVIIESETGNSELTIKKDTIGQTEEGKPLTEIWMIEIDKESSASSEDSVTIGYHLYCGPHGTTFDQPVTITITYDPNDLSGGVNEEELVIALWDDMLDEWVELEGCIVDTQNKTITVVVDHFSRYTIVAPVPPPPPAPPVGGGGGGGAGAAITTSFLEVDMLGKTGVVEIRADGTLRESLTITDPSGNFIIDIDRGTKVIGSNNMELSRIELTITEESIVVPDDLVVLSPIYKLTGYTRNMEVTRVNFEPLARLTISYDPEDLPENTFLPFIVNYTDEQGLVRLQLPPDSVVEIGKAKAEISCASLFAVVAELAPPPPPLPARFEVSNLIINPGKAQLGQPVVISLTIVNEGATAGSYQLFLKIDGIIRAVEETTLTANSIETVSFEVSNLAIGEHEVEVAGLTGQFRIISTAILPIQPTINWLMLDLSIGAGVVIGLLALYIFRRRSQQLQQED